MLASIKVNSKNHSSILEEKWMTPVSFISALKKAGLNIFPTGHSHLYVVINYKVRMNPSKFNVMDIQNVSKYYILYKS